MLNHLQAKADLAQKLVNRGPTSYTVQEYALVCAIRERSAGTLEGLTELSRLLVARQFELEDLIKQQNAVKADAEQDHGN